MNRREVLSTLASIVPAGVTATAAVVPVTEPSAMLAVLSCEHQLTASAIYLTQEHWQRLREETPGLPPLVILSPGMRLKIIDAKGAKCES